MKPWEPLFLCRDGRMRTMAQIEARAEAQREAAGPIRGQRALVTIIDEVESFTCPRCGMTSYNPNDVREGYCGNCHDWTGVS